VLSDLDLVSLERYVLGKNQLHNRYLHGAGVVCGLGITRDDCSDDLIVECGYALDCHGRDIVVPSPQSFDLSAAVRACLLAERSRPVCDPPIGQALPDCPDNGTWCVTLRYREADIRPQKPLVMSYSAPSCRCGGSSAGGTAVMTAAAGCDCGAGTTIAPGCEPTRTIECFELGVCRDDDRCHDLATRLAGTMPAQIVACLRGAWSKVSRTVDGPNQVLNYKLAMGKASTRDAPAAYAAVWRLHVAVSDLVHTCDVPSAEVLAELATARPTPQQPGESNSVYLVRAGNSVRQLLLLAVLYARDCICRAMLPPCPPCLDDDMIILGCVTVVDGKVQSLCNLSCRRYAGSFVSREYWLPVGPVLSWVAGLFCCLSIVRDSRGGRRDLDVLMSAHDPSGVLRDALADNDFAAVREMVGRAGSARTALRRAVSRLAPARFFANRVSLSDALGRDIRSARALLARRKIEVTEHAVASRDEIPWGGMGLLPLVTPGSRVTAYVLAGKVAAFRTGGAGSGEPAQPGQPDQPGGGGKRTKGGR
jgi:hypothetical protein